jgi:hypothetical protein
MHPRNEAAVGSVLEEFLAVNPGMSRARSHCHVVLPLI